MIIVKGKKLFKKVKAIFHNHKLVGKLKTKTNIPDNLKICNICLELMNEAKKLPCDHLFHEDCIRYLNISMLSMWLNSHTTCPVCNDKLELDENANLRNRKTIPKLEEHVNNLQKVEELEKVQKEEETKDKNTGSIQFSTFQSATNRDSIAQEKERLTIELKNRDEIIKKDEKVKKE